MSMPAESVSGRRHARQAEDRDPGDEGAAAAEPVADRASRKQQRGQRDRVAVDDPLLVGRRRAERGREVGTATFIIDTPATTSTRASSMVTSTAVRRPGEIGSATSSGRGSGALGARIRVWVIGTSRGVECSGRNGNGCFRY